LAVLVAAFLLGAQYLARSQENEITQAIASGTFTKAAKLAVKLDSLAAFEDMYLPVYNEDAVGLRITMELETRLDKLYAFAGAFAENVENRF